MKIINTLTILFGIVLSISAKADVGFSIEKGKELMSMHFADTEAVKFKGLFLNHFQSVNQVDGSRIESYVLCGKVNNKFFYQFPLPDVYGTVDGSKLEMMNYAVYCLNIPRDKALAVYNIDI